MSRISDISLAPSGLDKIRWVESYMPVLSSIKRAFEAEKPLKGAVICTSVHLEAKTACLVLTLAAGGAEVYATGCNPLSTQDDIAAALCSLGFEINAVRRATPKEYTSDLSNTLSHMPHLILDDGGDFTELLHGECSSFAKRLIGGTEETTTGVNRLRARHASGLLRFPMVLVNDAMCKHLFDNRYGTGQSTLNAIMQLTNLTIASRTVVVAGYGWCGRGVSMRARGMGARVIITEIDPVKAIEAVMDGFEVMTMDEAAGIGDIFITVTGCKDVITSRHMEKMRDGVLLANSGHFDVEISKPDLEALSSEVFYRKPSITGYRMKDGRVLNLLAEGRLVNLAGGNGHPAEIMDMSFALQAHALKYLWQHGGDLPAGLYPVPDETDRFVAMLKLDSSGIRIDSLTPEQHDYYYSHM